MFDIETKETRKLSTERMTYLGGLGYKPIYHEGSTYIAVPHDVFLRWSAILDEIRENMEATGLTPSREAPKGKGKGRAR